MEAICRRNHTKIAEVVRGHCNYRPNVSNLAEIIPRICGGIRGAYLRVQ